MKARFLGLSISLAFCLGLLTGMFLIRRRTNVSHEDRYMIPGIDTNLLKAAIEPDVSRFPLTQGSELGPRLKVRLRNAGRSPARVPMGFIENHPYNIWLLRGADGSPIAVPSPIPDAAGKTASLLIEPGSEYVFYTAWPACPELDPSSEEFRPGQYSIECERFSSEPVLFRLNPDGTVVFLTKR